MDLGSLELQIFVSLTVLLGGAFVALVCDYLKGNNEQLREHNIELRVRKEEQDRIMLLDPVGFLRQAVPQQQVQAVPPAVPKPAAAPVRPAAVHEMMQSFATVDALTEAEARAAALQARSEEEELPVAEVPPMTPRRNQRSRRKSNRAGHKNGEQYADWVRPEVIARVARQVEAAEVFHSDIREEIKAVKAEWQSGAQPAPLNAAENWDIRDHVPTRERPIRPLSHTESLPERTIEVPETPAIAAPEAPAVPAMETAPIAGPHPVAAVTEELPVAQKLSAEEAAYLQREREKVAQLERQPVSAAPGTILRPLIVPALRLEEELQRVSEAKEEMKPAAAAVPTPLWHSPLLDEVIAASANRSKQREEEPRPAVEEPVAAASAGVSSVTELPLVVDGGTAESWFDLAPPVAMPEDTAVAPPSAEPILAWLEMLPAEAAPEAVSTEPSEAAAPPSASEILTYYSFAPQHSALAGAGVLPSLDYLSGAAPIETPVSRLELLNEPELAASEMTDSEPEAIAFLAEDPELELPELLPLEEEAAVVLPLWNEEPLTIAATAPPAVEAPAPPPTEPPVPVTSQPPFDISAARIAEPEPVVTAPPAPSYPDLLLPTGMHDFSTWARLLSLPNPMTGILFIVSLHNNEDSSLPERKGLHIGEEHAPAIDRLMSSFVREGDFGSRISDREWVFIYSNDVAGFNQRRVGMISEKLWDFQLRHLGLARITFRWGVIDVKREPLAAAANAARERMNQTRRTKKLPGSGAAAPRHAVNA